MIRRALVFGASGQIGAAVAATFAKDGWTVEVATRGDSQVEGAASHVAYDPFGTDPADADSRLADGAPLDAVVWAQGANGNDSLLDFDAKAHLDMLKANCLYVSQSLAALLRGDRLTKPSRLCVVSSIWQTAARQNKFSYTVSKAALQGLIMSAAVDLAERGCLVNAILPGVLETPMTRAMLSPDQMARVCTATPFGRLASLQDVAELALFLCSSRNTSITGQFVAVDLGFLNAHLV